MKKIIYRTEGGINATMGLEFQKRSAIIFWIPKLMNNHNTKLCPELLGDSFLFNENEKNTLQMKQSNWCLNDENLHESIFSSEDAKSLAHDIKNSINISNKVTLITNKTFKTSDDGIFSFETVNNENYKSMKKTIQNRKIFNTLEIKNDSIKNMDINYFPLLCSPDEYSEINNNITFEGNNISKVEFGKLISTLEATYVAIHSWIKKTFEVGQEIPTSKLQDFSLTYKDVELRLQGRFSGGRLEEDCEITNILKQFRKLTEIEKKCIKKINNRISISEKREFISNVLKTECMEKDFSAIIKRIGESYE